MDNPAPTTPARRTLLTGLAATGTALVAGCGAAGGTGGSGDKPSGSGPRKPYAGTGGKELPRGGRKLFPRHRLVGYCGLPGIPELGRLGTGDLDGRVDEMEKKAEHYRAGREPLPVLELMATVTNSEPGADGTYRTRTDPGTIHEYLKAARRHSALLLLNVQPGRASMREEVEALHEWLVHPDVGVALDPEWDMGPDQIPGKTYGRTSGAEIAGIAQYLSGIVEDEDLPEKVLVFHQVSVEVVPGHDELRSAPGIALIKSADGIGSPHAKREAWKPLVRDLPEDVHTGFKLFFTLDPKGGRIMTPDEVLRLSPQPEYVMYE